jgi:hypothetical protein
MSTSKKQILSDELILGWIEGNLSAEESKRVEKLIKSSDKYFSRFSTLFAAYKEIEEVELEVTPDMLIERAKAEFQLDEKKKAGGIIPENLLQSLRGIKDFIVVQKVRLAVVSTAMLTLLMIGRVALIRGPALLRSPAFVEKSDSDTINAAESKPEWLVEPKDDKVFMAKDDIKEDIPSMLESLKSKLVKMPDFAGMKNSEIIDSLNVLQLKYKILYSEKEFSQTPEAGTITAISDSVTITLKTKP